MSKLNVTSVTFPAELLAQTDERVTGLDMNRSQYFRALVRKDLTDGVLAPVKKDVRFSLKPKSGAAPK